MSDPNYDGLCGIPLPAPLEDGSFLRCRLDVGHYGDHDWKKHERSFFIGGVCYHRDFDKEQFKKLVLMSAEEYEEFVRRENKRKSKSIGDENCFENS